MTVDFYIVDELADARDAATRWVADNVDPAWAEEQHRTGDYHTPELHRRMARDGWLGAGWPKEYGGTDNDPDVAQAIWQELGIMGFHADAFGATRLIMRTVLKFGTEEQKQYYIGGALRGDVLIALGYTEPDSGSDAAAAKTRADRDGDEWVITGQKMFTSTAQLCTHVFLLTRSNWEVPKHEGLTTFIVPLDAPGVEIHPMHTVGGQRTNATYYTEVRVPDSARIGDAGGGWGVTKVSLGYEHGARPPDSGPTLAMRVAEWAQQTTRPDGTKVFDDPTVQERLARIAIDDEIANLLQMRSGWMVSQGGMPGTEGAMAKLFGPEAHQRHYSMLQDIVGPEAVLDHFTHEAPLDGAVDTAFRYAIVGTIYGGSSEIMRELISQRHHGFPRSRPSKSSNA